MLRPATTCLARVYGGAATSAFVPGNSNTTTSSNNVTTTTSPARSETVLHGRKARHGSLYAIAGEMKGDEKRLRQHLNELLADERDPWRFAREAAASTGGGGGGVGSALPQKKLVDLPGVERRRDLPADPITRLFFQHKGDNALYYGTYDRPSRQDADRVQIERREPRKWTHNVLTPMYDFCHRLREGSEQRKRFVVVPSTMETRGCAKVLLDHGLVAGFRDFHNDRAFAVELKYFQNESTIDVIEPCAYDGKTEFEWSPKMMRRLMNTHGIHNRMVIYVCRTADNRIIDHIQAVKENIGGRGLMMAH